MEKIFEGKVALVTGGSFGIGRATAIAFARMGAKVVIADLLDDKENDVVKFIQGEGGTAAFIKCNVSVSAEVGKMMEQIISTFGKLDFAFNNAGAEGATAITHECSEENWDKTLGVNLKGIWLCMKH